MRIKTFIIFLFFSIGSCGTIYIPQILPEARGVGKASGQDDIKVTVVPITENSLINSNLDPYVRRVIDASDLTKPAKLVSVNEAISEQLPSNEDAGIYRLGIGDELTILQKEAFDQIRSMSSLDALSDQQNSQQGQIDQSSRLIERILSIADDGFVSILGVGRVQLAGLTQFEAEDLLYRELVINENSPQFELKISAFKSKNIYLTGEGYYKVIPYTNLPIYLHQLLGSNFGENAQGALKKGQDSLILIKRDSKIFRMSLKAVIEGSIKNIRIFPEDRISIEALPYRSEKAIIAGEVKQQKLIDLSAFERPSLAEALYSSQVFVTLSSDTSQIFVLREKGQNITAYHLDASNPSRLSLATKFELRPNDIVYIAPQFVTNYNRALTQIFSTFAVTDEIL
jgi:polysaccharide export outer membrane protein